MSRAIDLGAASFFAGATGYSTLAVSASLTGALIAGAVAWLAAYGTLGSVRDEPSFTLPAFSLSGVDAAADPLPELLLTERTELLLTELAELLLTEIAPSHFSAGELLLEDILPAPSRDSRVIRLFDPRTLQSPEEMHEPIERHLQEPEVADYPDATGELHHALAALRKSLR